MSIAAKYVDEFLSGMEKSGKTLYNKTIKYVRGMDTDDNGKLYRSTGNLDAINEITDAFAEFFSSATFTARKVKLLNSTSAISTGVEKIFEDKYGSLSSADYAFMLETEQNYRNALEGTLNNDDVEAAITNPVINALYYSVGSYASLDDLEERYRGSVEDAFHAYYVTKVTVLLEQYERSLISGLAKNFNTKTWEYFGPEDERNREFCALHVGKVFTTEEVKALANEEWAGKIPGTTMETIFINAGGYNCRHIFLPSDSETPSSADEPEPLTPDIVEAMNKPFRPEILHEAGDNHRALQSNDTYVFSTQASDEKINNGAASGLDEYDTKAIHGYTNSLYEPLNAAARRGFEGDKFGDFDADQIKRLDENMYRALEKMDLRPPMEGDQQLPLYRLEHVSDTLQVYEDAYAEGKPIEMTGYTSTSYSKNSAFFPSREFDNTYALGEDNRFRIIIQPKEGPDSRGRQIEYISAFDKEQEVLFLRGTKFQVVNIERGEYRHLTIVTLKEL